MLIKSTAEMFATTVLFFGTVLEIEGMIANGTMQMSKIRQLITTYIKLLAGMLLLLFEVWEDFLATSNGSLSSKVTPENEYPKILYNEK